MMLAASTAAGSVLTIDPAGFSQGQDISHAIPGITLSTVTLAPTMNGGLETFYAADLGPVYAFDGTFASSPNGNDGWGLAPYGGDDEPSSCLQGCYALGTPVGQWLRIDFNTPVNYVEALQSQNMWNAASLAAFSSTGQLLDNCLGPATYVLYGTSGCMSADAGQISQGDFTTQRPWIQYTALDGSRDISTILVASLDGSDGTKIGTIEYGSIPEPATYGLMGLDLIALAWTWRRNSSRT